MLKYYVRRSVGEEFEKVTHPPVENVWIHGDRVTLEELELIAKKYHMDINVLHDVLDKGELPHAEIHEGAMYVFVRTARRGKHGKIITTPLLLAVKNSVFINVSTIDINDTKPASLFIAGNTFDAETLLLGTFAAIVGEYEVLMKKTAEHVHDTGQRLRTHEVTNDDFIRFVTVEDNLNEYHMNLSAMLVAAERLQNSFANTKHAEAVNDILQYIRQLIVAINSHSQSITSIRNAYGTIANNVLNQRMKTLTVLTLLVALPNVFYGMYGMNVALPFAEEPWAYGFVVLFTIFVVIAVFVLAKKKGVF